MAAIDFPNTPANGGTYTFSGITHTYVGTHPNGYWTVNSQAVVGVASIDEINIGTEPVKYIPPNNLNASKYIREQQTGVTNLTFSGLDKAITSGTGLTVLGDIIADNIGGGYTATDLFTGAQSSGSVVPSEPLTNFDKVGFVGGQGGSYTQWTSIPVSMITFGVTYMSICTRYGSTSNGGVSIRFTDANSIQIIAANQGQYLQKIYGEKFG